MLIFGFIFIIITEARLGQLPRYPYYGISRESGKFGLIFKFLDRFLVTSQILLKNCKFYSPK